MSHRIPSRVIAAAAALLALGLQAGQRPPQKVLIPYEDARPILDALAEALPPELKDHTPGERAALWADWASRRNGEIRARPINNFDLTASKKFNITEGIRIEFQAQFLNLLNHPEFAPGYVNRVDYPLNTFTGAGRTLYLRPSTAVFNHPEQVF